MKLPASDILRNIGDKIPSDIQVAYIATDERNKSFFDPFRRRFSKVFTALTNYKIMVNLRVVWIGGIFG